jgi:hypothetical protein
MKSIYMVATVSVLMGLSLPLMAENPEITIVPAPSGSVTLEEGLIAWGRVFEVTSHPRCSNCHVGPSERPMWSGPAYGKSRTHGMNIIAGESRIGAETIQCSTCHAYREGSNDVPHAAPQVAMNWQLAPVEADWFGKTSEEVCTQLRDPERNGGRTMLELAEHLNHDLILHWAWNPGGGREAAPYSLQEHIDDLLVWGVAGFPCESD